jgi:hypothetical protein
MHLLEHVVEAERLARMGGPQRSTLNVQSLHSPRSTVRPSSQSESGSTLNADLSALFYSLPLCSLEIFLECLPINLASLNKGHLLQHDNSYGHLPWLQGGANKILNRFLRDSTL